MPTQTDEPFGDAIVELMRELEISNREMARRAGGMSPGGGTISHYTKGYINPEYEAMERIAKALEVPPTFFPEYRLETIRRRIDWHAPRSQMPKGRRRQLRSALHEARSLGLDV